MPTSMQGLWMGTVAFICVMAAVCLLSCLCSLTGKGLSRYDNSLCMFLTCLAGVQMWLVWICVYLSQMNPIIYPYVIVE